MRFFPMSLLLLLPLALAVPPCLAQNAPMSLPAGPVAAPLGTPVPVGTPVLLRLGQRLRSGEAVTGQTVALTVAEPVLSADKLSILVPVGTPVTGRVAESHGAGAFGRPGRLRVTFGSLQAADGTPIPLRPAGDSDGSGEDRGGAAAFSGVLVGGAAFYGVGTAIAFNNLFSSSHGNGVTPVLAGVGAGLVTGALWRGGDVTLPEGARLQATVGGPSDTR